MALNDILPYEYFENYFTYIIAIRLLTENNIILNMMEKTEFENNEYIFFKREKRKIILLQLAINLFNIFKFCFFHHV